MRETQAQCCRSYLYIPQKRTVERGRMKKKRNKGETKMEKEEGKRKKGRRSTEEGRRKMGK
jgi:hypothetical protein